MKKFLLFIILLIPFGAKAETYINKQNIEITEMEYNRLLNLGFNDKEIDNMPLNIFEENKNLIGYVESSETKYYKTSYFTNNVQTFSNNDNYLMSITTEISESEYYSSNEGTNQLNVSSPAVETEYKRLITHIIKVDSSYRVKSELTWRKMPKVRSNDIMAIGINQAVVEGEMGTYRAYTTAIIDDSCLGTCSATSENHNKDSNWYHSPGGHGVKFPLIKDSTIEYRWGEFDDSKYPCKDGNSVNMPKGRVTASLNVVQMSTTMYYDLLKIVNGPISAYGAYRHGTYGVSISGISFGLSATAGKDATFGISLNVSIDKKFDNMSGTYVQLKNPSW